MYIPVKLYNLGEVKLFLQPYSENGVENGKYILVRNEQDINNPFMMLELKQNHFSIIAQHDVVEEEDSLQEKLDELALSAIAAIQRGDDLADTNISSVLKPYNPDKIRVESKNFSLKQIYDMIKNGDLNLHPDFQRNLVWDDFRKSRLIESILLRIPLPMFYFAQDEEGILSVVDGLQRLSAIFEFMSNKLVLRDLEYLENCNGKTYSKEGTKIDDKYVRWFNMTQIVVNVIDPQSPSKVKFDIFRRINTGGRPLNAQELRNSISGNGLRQTLQEMVKLKSFKNATGGSIKDTRMNARELALRFIYFRKLIKDNIDDINNYSGNIDDELDNLVDKIGKTSAQELSQYVEAFDRAMTNAYHLLGHHAFRRIQKNADETSARSVINKALFASESVLLAEYDINFVKKSKKNCLISPLAMLMSNNSVYSYYLSYGTNGKQNIIYVFKETDNFFKNNFKQI